MSFHTILPWIVAQAKQAAPADANVDELSVALRLLMAVGVIAGSFIAGDLIARALRLREFSFRIGLVLFTIVASLAINFVGWPPKRGIDLSGGVVLVYEVDRGLTKPSWMPSAIAQLSSDLNKGEEEKVEVRPGSSGQVEIVAPAGYDVARIEKAVSGLRNTIALTMHRTGEGKQDGKIVLRYDVDQQHKAVEMDKLIAAVGRRINPGGVKELTIRQYGAEQLEVIVPEVEEHEIEQIKRRISTAGLLEFRIVANNRDDKELIRAAGKTLGTEVYIGGKLAGRWVKAGPELVIGERAEALFRETEGRGREVLARIDIYNVDGRFLERASPGDYQGRPAVNFTFDNTGATKFGQLTSHNVPDEATEFFRHLGIVLDNVMISAPTINETIRGNGQIHGNFTREEVDFLVGVLNAGSLPASLRPEPISQQRISAQLGDDTIRQGSRAMIVSTVAVLIFMGIYYRFAGLVADFGVILNVIITVALMILIKAAFTLPGLAGLALTVGMAVDANVLIYERMREEQARGASLRMAIRNGFARATSTIIDSNVTTVISAIVLYAIGTDQIKGFAVTLILGLCVSMFTAIYVSRLIFDIFEKKRWLTQLRMMQFVGETHIDFIRWRMPAIVGSVVLIAIGMVATAARGIGLLDIDFTGGSSVHVLFAEGKGLDIAEVREAVAELPDVAVSSVGENNREFKIDTSEGDIAAVQNTLQSTFGDALQTHSLKIGEPTTIEAPKEEAKPSEGAETSKAVEEKPSDAAEAAKNEETKPDEPQGESAEEQQPPKSSHRSSGGLNPFRLVALQESASTDAAEKATSQSKTDAPKADAPKAERSPGDAQPASDEKPAADENPASESNPANTAPVAAAETPGGSLVGGTRVELTFPQTISYEPLSQLVSKQLAEMNLAGTSYRILNPKYKPGSDAPYGEWTLEIALDQAQTRALLSAISDQLAATPVFPSSNQIGGKVAGDTQLMALYALLASMVMIVVYVWVRFQNVIFGLAAVLALVHDVLMAVAFLAMSYYLSPYLGALMVDQFKISLAVVAALLTIVGFSINDTIVIFDRIREIRGKSPELTAGMINLAVNQTLSRTILTSGTVFIATLVLFFMGGPGIHAFAFTMVIGVIAGSYSTVYIAAPVLLWLKRPLTAEERARMGRTLAAEAREAARAGAPSSFTKSSERAPPAA